MGHGAAWRPWLVVALLVAGGVAPGACFYESETSSVTTITSEDIFGRIDGSKLLWVVEVYKTTCPHCQGFAPEFEAAAAKLKNLVHFAAIDIDKHNALVQKFESRYNFKLNEVPLVFYLKPLAGKGKKWIKMDSKIRQASVLIKDVTQNMPDFTQGVSLKGLEKYLAQPISKALLFTSKTESPSIWRALSSKYLNRIAFGLVVSTSQDTKAILKRLGSTTTEFPAVFAIRADKDRTEGEDYAVEYGGTVGFAEVDAFLQEYASDKPAPKNRVKNDSKIRIKGKDLTKFSIAELKDILSRWHDTCLGCVEKHNFIDRINTLRRKLGDRDPIAPLKMDDAAAKSKADAFVGDFEACKQAVGEGSEKMRALEQELIDLRNERDALISLVEDLQSKTTDCLPMSGNALDTDPGNEDFVMVTVEVDDQDPTAEDVVYEDIDDNTGSRRTEL